MSDNDNANTETEQDDDDNTTGTFVDELGNEFTFPTEDTWTEEQVDSLVQQMHAYYIANKTPLPTVRKILGVRKQRGPLSAETRAKMGQKRKATLARKREEQKQAVETEIERRVREELEAHGISLD